MVNGCMCCVLVGQMKLALQELKGKKKRWRFDCKNV
jgi:G3E family GTPase